MAPVRKLGATPQRPMLMATRPLVTVLTCGILLAQQPAGNEPAEPATDPFRFTLSVVVAPTTVTDKGGKHVHNIQPHEFRLFDNNKQQDIRVDATFVPVSLVVAVQADAAAEPVLPHVQKVGSVIQGLVTGDEGEAAILAFDHRVETLQDFTADNQKISDALKKLKPGSSSSRLNDAAMHGIRLLRNKPQNRRRVLMLISETRDKNSELHLREVLTEAQVHNVTVYTINMSRLVTSLRAKTPVPRPDPIPTMARRLPPGAAQTPTAVAAYTGTGSVIPLFTEIFNAVKGVFIANPAELLTKYTGGEEYTFRSQRDLEEAIRAIGYDLHSQYIISYNPNNQSEGGFHEIRVEISRSDLNIRTRPGYWIATRPQ